jgi:hypothetical protein
MNKTKSKTERVFKSLNELKVEYFPESLKKEAKLRNQKSGRSYGVILADDVLNAIKKEISRSAK